MAHPPFSSLSFPPGYQKEQRFYRTRKLATGLLVFGLLASACR
jgi:hypothetical protein